MVDDHKLEEASQPSRSDIGVHGVVGLGDLFQVIWRRKALIAGVTMSISILAALLSYQISDVYRAEALLAPNLSSDQSGLRGLASSYGSLMQLANLGVGGEAADKTDLGIETLRSRKFIAEFINRHDLKVPLMASDGWDKYSGELIIDLSLFDPVLQQWVRDVKPPRRAMPSDQESFEEFSKRLHINRVKTTGFVSIAISHYSPIIARQWVDLLVNDLNATIQRQDVEEAQNSINYLQAQIDETPLADLKQVFYQLIGEQIQTVTLANATDEYLFKIIDPAIVPEEKYGPSRILIIISAFLLSGIFSCIYILASPAAVNRAD